MMGIEKRTSPFRDEFIIYYSKEDASWVAHSLHTDQMGFGDCVVDALVDLMIGLHNLLNLAKREKVQVLFEAPDDIKEFVRTAKPIAECILQIAIEKFQNRIPPEYTLHVDIPQTERLKASYEERSESAPR